MRRTGRFLRVWLFSFSMYSTVQYSTVLYCSVPSQINVANQNELCAYRQKSAQHALPNRILLGCSSNSVGRLRTANRESYNWLKSANFVECIIERYNLIEDTSLHYTILISRRILQSTKETIKKSHFFQLVHLRLASISSVLRRSLTPSMFSFKSYK